MKKEHYIKLSEDEYQIFNSGYLTGLPNIIKSLEFNPQVCDQFFQNYEEIKEKNRKVRRIGISGEEDERLSFYRKIEAAVEGVMQNLSDKKLMVSKQAVFWMAAFKLTSARRERLSA